MSNEAHGHIRKRKNGLWEGQYVFQKHRRSIYGETEVEVYNKLEGILNAIHTGTYVRPNEHTVKSWLLEWLDTYARVSLRPSTFMNYEAQIKIHMLPAFGKMLLRNVSVETLQTFFNGKLTGGRLDHKSGGLSVKTLKNMRHILNVAFSQAYYNRILSFNPVEGTRLPVPDQPEQRVLNEHEKEILLQAATSKHTMIAKGVIILLNCGLRKGELLGLTWTDVDLAKNSMHIRHTLGRLAVFEITSSTQGYVKVNTHTPKNSKTAIYLGPVKTKKGNRTIYLPDSVRKAVIELKELQAEYRNAYSGKTFNSFGFILCSKEGQAMDPKVFEEGFSDIVSEAKLKKINVHATRHTFATEALQKSTDLIAISEILGHAKPSTTLDMYGHTFDDRKRSLMSLFE